MMAAYMTYMLILIPAGEVYSPDRRYTDNGYFCNQYGYIAYDDYGVTYSYGNFSILLIQKYLR